MNKNIGQIDPRFLVTFQNNKMPSQDISIELISTELMKPDIVCTYTVCLN